MTSSGQVTFLLPVRALLVALLLLAAAACGAYHFPGAPSAGTGTVSGQVTVRPCAPVEPVMKPCVTRPASGIEINFSGNGTMVSTSTDSRGFYSIGLASGTWKVSFKGYQRIIGGPPVVTVNPGAMVVADYVVDSGIRYAVSKEPSTNPHPPEGVPAAA